MKAFVDKLNKLEEIIASGLLIATSLVVFYQVILRYVFGTSLIWAEEAARYMIVWFIFLGASMCVRDNSHPTVDILYRYLPKRLQSILNLIIYVVCIIFCGVVLHSGILVVGSAQRISSTSAAMQIPLWIVYIAVPLGVGLMLLRYIYRLYEGVVILVKKEEGGEA